MADMDFFQAEKVFNSALAALIGSATLAAEQHVGGRKNGSFEQRRVLHQKDISSSIPKDVTAGLKLEQCPLLNISYCPTSEAELPFGKSLVVVVYNPLGWSREEYIHFPVSSSVLLEVIDGAGNAVPSQLLPLPQSAYRLRKFYMDGDEASMTSNNYNSPLFHLVFSAVVPPLGYTTFRVRRASSSTTSSPYISIKSTVETRHTTPTVELTSSQLQLSFSSSTGLLAQLTNSKTGVCLSPSAAALPLHFSMMFPTVSLLRGGHISLSLLVS
jgi:alpha-mannosidase